MIKKIIQRNTFLFFPLKFKVLFSQLSTFFSSFVYILLLYVL